MTEEPKEQPAVTAERLCSEIQLFDLCDLESCRFKKGRFCRNEKLLADFEAIQEEDDRNQLLYEESEEDEDLEEDFDDLAEYEDEEE